MISILKKRCPKCREGRIFASWFRMNPNCPHCDLVFEREPGYFLGAMYFSYGFGILVLLPLVVILVKKEVAYPHILIVSFGTLLLLSPWLFQYSRTAWLYMDQTFDPR